MRASRFISERLDFRGRLTVAATAVSFFVIALSLIVTGGFRREIRLALSELAGDVQMSASVQSIYGEGEPVSVAAPYVQRLREEAGVEEIKPVIYRSAVVKAGGSLEGVLFKAAPSQNGGLSVSVPSSMAKKLSLEKGDRLLTYFVGEKVKIRNFTVGDIYEDPLRADDRILVFCSLGDLQRVNGWDSTEVSSFEVKLSPRYAAPEKQKRKAAELSFLTSLYSESETPPLVATAAAQRYARIFDWLNLLDFNVLAILLLMTLVAGFNMVSGLLIVLFRNTSAIGTLKALGMGDRGISEVFLRLSSKVVLKGMGIGVGAALLFALIQGGTRLIRLNPVNYFVSFVPVSVNPLQLLLVCALCYAAIMLILLLPTLFIGRVSPSETIRIK